MRAVSSLSRAISLHPKEATWTGMFVVAELSVVGENCQAAPLSGQSWPVPKRRGEQRGTRTLEAEALTQPSLEFQRL